MHRLRSLPRCGGCELTHAGFGESAVDKVPKNRLVRAGPFKTLNDSVGVRRATRITLSAEEWARLRRWITDRRTPARVRRRARILLGAAVGRSNREIARTLSLDPATVSFWRRRFAKHRLEGGLLDAPRPGRRKQHTAGISESILHATYHVPPPAGARWTTRSLARHLGVNHMQVHRTWKSHGVPPDGHPPEAERPARLAPSPRVDLLGVILQPPRRAVVFGLGNESGTPVPTLEPVRIPVPPAISGGFLQTLEGSEREELVEILKRMETFVGRESGSASEWHDLLILLRDLEDRTSPSTQVHVLVENCDEAEAERLAGWFDRHARFHLHGFPAGSDWLEGIRELLAAWAPAGGKPWAIGGVASFATAAARFAEGPTPESRGLVWSVPTATFPTPLLWEAGDGEPSPFVPRRGSDETR